MNKIKLLLVIPLIIGSLVSCTNIKSVVLKIPENKDKSSIGTIILKKVDGATMYTIDISKGSPNTNYQFSLHGGKDELLSASIILIDQLKTDDHGIGKRSGTLRYRGSVDIRFEDIADNNHTITISTRSEEYRLTIPQK